MKGKAKPAPQLTNAVQNLRLSRLVRTQKELEQKTGIHRRYICQWELGKARPNPEQAAILADFFGVCMDEIYGRSHKGGLVVDVPSAMSWNDHDKVWDRTSKKGA